MKTRGKRWLDGCRAVLCGFFLFSIAIVPMNARAAKAAKKKRSYQVWEDRGDGMYSLDAASVAMDPKDPKRLYAAADGVFYISKDGGQSWRPTARFRGASRVQVETIDETGRLRKLKERILEEKLEDLAAEIGEERAREQADSLEREAEEEAEEQLRRSRQAAQSGASRGRFSRFVYRIVIKPSNPKHIIVTTDGGAFLSTDQGKTFQTWYRGRGPGVGNVKCIALSPTNPKLIWLGTQAGLWTTHDGGKTWNRDGGMLRAVPISEIKVAPHNPKVLYVTSPRSLFVSTNQGNTFLRAWTIATGPDRITTMTTLATKPRTTVVVGTGSGLYAGFQGSLRRLKRLRASGLTSRRIVYITNSPRPFAARSLYVVNDQGVFLSRNAGRRFSQMREGMLTNNIRYVAASPHFKEVLWAATDYGMLRWSRLIGRKVTQAQWQRFSRKLRREPRPWRLARACLKAALLGEDFASIHRRNALRRFLPQLRASFKLYFDQDQNNLTLVRSTPLPINLLEGRSFLFEVALTWSLQRLVFAQQTRVTSSTTSLRRFRDRLIKRVNRLFHARRRLQIRLFLSPSQKLRPFLRQQIKLQELTAQLDVLTGGYLKRRLEKGR